MTVPNIIRDVTRNVREALSSREQFKEKAKDLPLYVLQSALSGVGQALLLGDRVRGTIKRLTNQEEQEEAAERRGPAGQTGPAGQDTAREAEEEPREKPRRAPVIFAPRPESAASRDEVAAPAGEAGTGSNGAKARPEPVIFAPAKPRAAEPEVTEPEPAKQEPAQPEAAKPEVTEAKVAEPETAKPETAEAEAAEPETAKQEPAGAQAAEPKTARTETAEPKATKSRTAKPKATGTAAPEAGDKPAGTAEPRLVESTEAAGAGVVAPPAAEVEVTEVHVATPGEADTPVVEVTGTKAARPEGVEPPAATVEVPEEPMPGYGQLTVASLRARMRGKSAEQVRLLLAYERATAARPEVVRMYENRLAKLEAAE
ncbi:hypothetical protein GCM10027187_72710 [Streptosporangium sandarakinum]|uniref:Meckel syndrome type 1 protein n=1 Tax=Streptosporangium sandarakinum TaxID=1260955 RepID=A0A852UYF8_9ACTN|nr:hypothetical protein [Streptosporangium sandarakinum]NYF42697.1 hypothetical protein [Streptosporangium sandarakinum]